MSVARKNEWALVLLRLVVGFGFAAHGYAKLVRGPETFAAILEALAVPAPVLMAWATTLLELLGGVSLMLGAFVLPLSIPLGVVMATAMFTVHLRYGFSSIRLQAFSASGAVFGPVGYELNLIYLASLLVLAACGPSPVSVDRWRRKVMDRRRRTRLGAPGRPGEHRGRRSEVGQSGQGSEGEAMTTEQESRDLTVSSQPGAGPEEIAVVREGLHHFNFDATGFTEVHTVALFVRDRGGAIRGGLLGYVWGGWLHITELWIAEPYRRHGLGRQLLDTAEREAASSGARGAFLSTFDFQAPDFYQRCGYVVQAMLPDHPLGHTDCHLQKVF